MTIETTPSTEPLWWGSVPSWTPSLAKRAYVDCQSGQLAMAAHLCDALLTDGRIRGVLETRKNTLFGCDLDFEPAGHKGRSTPIVRALKDDGEFWSMASEPTLGQVFIWGLLLNVGLGELTWRYVDKLTESEADQVVARDSRWCQLLTPKHPRNLRKDPLSGSWLLATADAKEIEVTPGDGRWLMYSPFGANSPFERGLWYALVLLWLSKTFSDFDWGRRNEARGRAALVGSSPEGATDADRDLFAKQIAELRTKLGIALPKGWELKAVEFGGDDYETFKARIDWADSAIGTLVVGQNLTADVRVTSLAAPKTNDKVRQDYLEQDAESFSTCLHDHMLSPYAEVRYSDRNLAPWPRWNTEPPEDIVQAADTTDKASKALGALLDKGVPVDVPAYCERFRIPLIKGAPVVRPTKEPASAPKEEKDKKDDVP